MKPHEETWSIKPNVGGGMMEISSDTDGPALLGYDPRQIGVWPEQDAKRVALIAAAPEMARALKMMLMENGHLRSCQWGRPPEAFDASLPCNPRCEQVRAALTKAGVPLP